MSAVVLPRPAVFLLTVLVAFPVAAVKKGDPLYIRVKDTRVFKAADLRGTPIAFLQPGTTVKWLGVSTVNRLLHQVEFEDTQVETRVTGFVLQANLSPNKVSPEFLMRDDGKPIDAQAFKSSGAATKALGDMALQYASHKKLVGAPERLMALEAISASVDPKALDARARTLGLAIRDPAEPEPKSKAKKGKKK